MSSSYYPKDDSTYHRSVEVQKLTIPFFITHNATPASKVITVDAPALLFLDVQGINNCTVASGAFDSSAEQSAITFASPSDTAGSFSLLVRVGNGQELVGKVMYARVVSRSNVAPGVSVMGQPSSGSSPAYITLLGDKVVCDVVTGVNLATTDGDFCLELEYIAKPTP